VPAPNSTAEPVTVMPSTPLTITCSENDEATSTTTPIDQILDNMISSEVTGITSRCSMVPCSRSRISAAPVSRMPSMVTLLMIALIAANQLACRFGLNIARGTSSTGCGTGARTRCTKARTSSSMMLWM